MTGDQNHQKIISLLNSLIYAIRYSLNMVSDTFHSFLIHAFLLRGFSRNKKLYLKGKIKFCLVYTRVAQKFST